MRLDPVQSHPGRAVRPGIGTEVHRLLPEESPVALVFDGTTVAVMMASPADLKDFAHGFAVSEGIVTGRKQIVGFELAEHRDGIEARFWLREDRAAALAARRRAMAGPVGCGLCGIDSLAAAMRPLPDLHGDGPVFSADQVAGLGAALRTCQPMHDATRAVHAAGFARPGRAIALSREDVGRHNALDKLIGAAFRADIDLAGGAIVMTSRLSTELVQKCAMAGCRVLIAVSAPTAHAVRLAQACGMTLVAFAGSGGGAEVYAHPHRIMTDPADVA